MNKIFEKFGEIEMFFNSSILNILFLGREALIEEKTERLFGDIDGFRQPIVLVDRSKALMDFSNSEVFLAHLIRKKNRDLYIFLNDCS